MGICAETFKSLLAQLIMGTICIAFNMALPFDRLLLPFSLTVLTLRFEAIVDPELLAVLRLDVSSASAIFLIISLFLREWRSA